MQALSASCPGVPERRVAKIVRERDRFGQVLVETQIAGDGATELRYFQAVREARAEQIAFVIDKDLRLVFETPEGRGMDDAVAVALVLAASARRRFRVAAAARVLRPGGVDGEARVRHARRAVQDLGERRLRRFAHECGADLLQQYESQLAAFDFLVVAHEVEIALKTEIGRVDRQSRPHQQVAHACHIGVH